MKVLENGELIIEEELGSEKLNKSQNVQVSDYTTEDNSRTTDDNKKPNMHTTTEDLRYPIGKYMPRPFSSELKEQWLLDLKFLPDEMEIAIQNLDEAQLHTPYREGGWTVRQLVHHVADSHINAYVRFKLGLTEHNPSIKTYEEKDWAKLNDVETVPINVSLTLLHALHRRWMAAIIDISEEQWGRTIFHPEHKKEMSLWYLLGMYVWHGKHHVKHITALRERNGW